MAQSTFIVEDRHASPVRSMRLLVLICGMFLLGGCGPGHASPVKLKEAHVLMSIGASRFTVVLGDSDAARAFQKLLPLTLKMEELNGNEKHGELPKPLPVTASRPGTIRRGDLMLYGSTTLVLFYETFDSSYSYTRLGRVDDPAGLAEALGRGDARVSFAAR